jgi:hypothetical protein
MVREVIRDAALNRCDGSGERRRPGDAAQKCEHPVAIPGRLGSGRAALSEELAELGFGEQLLLVVSAGGDDVDLGCHVSVLVLPVLRRFSAIWSDTKTVRAGAGVAIGQARDLWRPRPFISLKPTAVHL